MELRQATDVVLMVRPTNFGFNDETATSNTYQQRLDLSSEEIASRVLAEFDAFVEQLDREGIQVVVIKDTETPVKPDAIFPNNWFTTHQDGMVYLYPMTNASRRAERRMDIIERLDQTFFVKEVIDLSFYEKQDLFLEGTGSMVFDHFNRTVYACESPRTSREPLIEYADRIGYRPVVFQSLSSSGQEQYHTNVVMCIGEGLAIVGLDSIPESGGRAEVMASLENSQHVVIPITNEQLEKHFAGNMLQVMNNEGDPYLVMSQNARNALTTSQVEQIEQFATILPVSIPTIETIGGGSARCMMAEIFLPKRI